MAAICPFPIRRPRLLAPLALALALTAAPALAIDEAKAALDELRAVAQMAGLALTAQGIETEGRALILQAVALWPEMRRGESGFTMRSLRIEPRDDGFIALEPAAEGVLVFIGPDRVTHRLLTRHRGSLLYRHRADGEAAPHLDLVVDFGQFALANTALDAPRPQARDWQAFSVDLTALAGDMRLSLGDEIDLTGQLTAELLGYMVAQEQSIPMRLSQTGDGLVNDIALQIDLRRLDLLMQETAPTLSGAFDQGFGLSVALQLGDNESRSVQESPFFNLSMDGRGGPGTLDMSLQNGLFDMVAEAQAFQVSMLADGMEIDLSVDAYDTRIRMPLVADAPSDRLEIGFGLRGFTLSPETLAALDLGAMVGDSAEIGLQVSAGLGFLADLMAPDPLQTPLTIRDIALDQLLLRLGATRLIGEGRLAPPPDASLDEDFLNDATGDFNFELEGGEALLDRLAGAGLLEADQIFFARMMIGLLGRTVGQDRYRSEISIAPGGAVTVNGLPLPF